MFGTKKRRIAELEDRLERLLGKLKVVTEERDTERFIRRTLAAESQATIKRLGGRLRHLREELDSTREGQQGGKPSTGTPVARRRLQQRLDRMRRACWGYRVQAAADAARIAQLEQQLREHADLPARLSRSEEARRGLEARLAELQAANDAMCRDALKPSPRLKTAEVAS